MPGRGETAAYLMRSSPALSLPAARRTTCSPTWREQALTGLCSQPPQQLRVRSLCETASHINVHHVERILRGLEPTQSAGRAARRRRTSRCPFRKDTQLFKSTHGFSRLERMNGAYAASKAMIEPRSRAHWTSCVSCSRVAAAPVGLLGEQNVETTSARSAFSRSGKKPFSGPHFMYTMPLYLQCGCTAKSGACSGLCSVSGDGLARQPPRLLY